MKKMLAILAAILIVVSAFSGCGDTESSSIPSSQQSESENVSSTMGNEESSTDEITQLLYVYTLGIISEDDLQDFYNSSVYAELRERTGVEILLRGADKDQAAIYFASGDLGDITSIPSQADILPAVESENILPLNDLVEQYGPNIIANRPERWEMAKNQLGVDDSGTAYVLPIRAGSEGHNYYPGHNIFYIRWDLYAEMGYPEVKNETDFLNVLAEMYKNNPTTAEGLPTYAVGFYSTTSDLTGFYKRWIHTYGYRDLGVTGIMFDVDNDGAMLNIFTDPIETFSGNDEPMFFAAAKYYNQAYHMGLLDQDSFTQQAADYAGKCTNGQYLSGWQRSQADVYVNAVLKEDPDSQVGFQVIPIEGMTLWTDTVQAAGWENFYLAIPSSAKDPVKSMQFINYLFSEEGCRLLFSGIEGEHWNVIDGEPVWTDEVIDAINSGTSVKLGVSYAPATYMLGLGDNEPYSKDGGPLRLLRGDDYLSKCLKPVDELYCEKYGVTYPLEVFLNMKEEGKANTHESLDMRVVSAMGSAPDDITLLNSSILKTAAEAIPGLVMAETDEEFDSLKAELLNDLESIGIQSVIDWYAQRHQEVLESFK